MWQEIITSIIIATAIVYTIVKVIKNFRNGNNSCGCQHNGKCNCK